jgi:hypothetical protein
VYKKLPVCLIGTTSASFGTALWLNLGGNFKAKYLRLKHRREMGTHWKVKSPHPRCMEALGPCLADAQSKALNKVPSILLEPQEGAFYLYRACPFRVVAITLWDDFLDQVSELDQCMYGRSTIR